MQGEVFELARGMTEVATQPQGTGEGRRGDEGDDPFFVRDGACEHDVMPGP
jgi:hypothetical protein